jgi:hypothetical protein
VSDETSCTVSIFHTIASAEERASERCHREEIVQRGNRHLDNLNFCVSQCRRWNFIAKDRENAVRKVKIAVFKKMRYPWAWKFCSINYCRITVSDHFYWFLFITSVNILFCKSLFFSLSTPY